MSQKNVEQVQEVFVRFGNGDVPAILEMLADDVIIDFYGPTVIPYAGHWEGKDKARQFFETVLANVEIHQFDTQEFIAERDKVVVFGHLNLTAKSTGGKIDSDFVHVITVQDGLWKHFRDFMNTTVATAAFAGLQTTAIPSR